MPLQITATEAKGFLHEPDEWLEATIVDIEDDTGEYGPSLKWIFHVDNDEYDDGNPRETWAWCSQTLSPRSKLGKWLAGLGVEVETGETVNLEDIVGNRCQIMFEQSPGVDPDGNPTTKEKVVKVRGSKTPAPKKEKTEPTQEDLEAPF